jgi:hypothetical protein
MYIQNPPRLMGMEQSLGMTLRMRPYAPPWMSISLRVVVRSHYIQIGTVRALFFPRRSSSA